MSIAPGPFAPQIAPEPGDVIAFAGTGAVSRLIRWVLRYPISHVAVVRDEDVCVEVTSLRGEARVFSRTMWAVLNESETLKRPTYLLKVHRGGVTSLDVKHMQEFLDRVEGQGVKYDFRQAIRNAVDWFRSRESDDRLFCSELVARAHEKLNLYRCNASEVDPRDLCRFDIYTCIVPMWVPNPFTKFNSINPHGFGVEGRYFR